MAYLDPQYVWELRKTFPILGTQHNGYPLTYLDSAASAQKPQSVIEGLSRFLREDYANVHRGLHFLSQRATEQFEGARDKALQFLNASADYECAFTQGTTESVNLIAHSYLEERLNPGDKVLVTAMEHHSNIIPWQMMCEKKQAHLVPIPIFDNGELDLDAFEALLDETVKLISVVHVSNTLGTINPIKRIVAAAKKYQIPVMVDGAQSVPHMPVDLSDLNPDFFSFSGHKLFGPTGIGALYIKKSIFPSLRPFLGGGEMIEEVSFEGSSYKTDVAKLEAGTPNIMGAVGLGLAIDFVNGLDRELLLAHEQQLLVHAESELKQIEGLQILGNATDKAAIVTFVIDGVHPQDLATLLDQRAIAIRTGHHCTQPLMQRFQVSSTARASFTIYNTHEEVARLAAAMHRYVKMLRS